MSKYRDDANAIEVFYRLLKNGKFKDHHELLRIVPTLDDFRYKDKWWVADLGGNHLWLIAFIEFRHQCVFVKYDANLLLIDVLWSKIHAYEEAPEFQEFNSRVGLMDAGASMLRLLMEQHNLTTSDFKEEIGLKSLYQLFAMRRGR